MTDAELRELCMQMKVIKWPFRHGAVTVKIADGVAVFLEHKETIKLV